MSIRRPNAWAKPVDGSTGARSIKSPVARHSRHQTKAAKPGESTISPSDLTQWWPILEMLGLSYREMANIEERAALTGVSFQVELLASGLVGETELFRALAAHLGIGFLDSLSPDRLLMGAGTELRALRQQDGTHKIPALDKNGRTILLIAPGRLDIEQMQLYLKRYPRLVEHMRIIPGSALRRAMQGRAKPALLSIANNGLFDALPILSARFVMNAWQGAVFGALTVALVLGMVLWPSASLLVLHGVLSLFFFACVLLRVAAGGNARKNRPALFLGASRSQEMPVYSVLVALYKEADVVPDLLVALGRLVWPRSKLEIKLVCESDDEETLAALRSQQLRSCIEIIEVPPEGPRTKPKALSYALPMTTGNFVVLFDAEDRPHPFQLVEAWQSFREGDESLACVQAPLIISNRHESWISAMFAFEYSALFRGLLPWLSRHGLTLPLGGTSNHFRRDVLERIGGWDPCNVTEDADLGVRLARAGYRTETITYPTYEDAPTTARIWLPQRTRWFKGWAQTWLVHMRNASQLFRELGPASFAVTQVLVAGMLISALAYPVFALTILALASSFFLGGPLPAYHWALLAIDITNILLGHGAFLALGWWTLPRTERRGLLKYVFLIPAYWLLMSAAAWRALWLLHRRPHHWEKTPHLPRSARDSAAQSKRSAVPVHSASPVAVTATRPRVAGA